MKAVIPFHSIQLIMRIRIFLALLPAILSQSLLVSADDEVPDDSLIEKVRVTHTSRLHYLIVLRYIDINIPFPFTQAVPLRTHTLYGPYVDQDLQVSIP